MTVRAKIYRLLDSESLESASQRMRGLEVVINLIGIVLVSVGTLEALSPNARAIAAFITGVVAFLFFVEYLTRLWVAPEAPHSATATSTNSRIRWAFSIGGIIDLLAIIPALAAASGSARLGAESASVFVLLWVLKLATRVAGVKLIGRVIRNERSSLAAVAALFLIVLFSAATIAHWLEAESQPQHFGSIPTSLWWAVVTLTTTGYGDAVPVSALGRMLGGLVMLCGISVLALLSGILANGFAEELRRREFVRIWDLVARVPFFSDVGAIAIADIVSRLRSRSFPAGATVIREGETGDSMFFLVNGTVMVRRGLFSKLLYEGQFFGEMALLDRKPRTADVTTQTPCTVLVLNVADFYHLAGQQPGLVSAIEAEAKRRRMTSVDTTTC
jgi:voltage-gated potassium channel